MTVQEGKNYLKTRPDLTKKVWVINAGFDNKVNVLKVGETRYPLKDVYLVGNTFVYKGKEITIC